MLCVYSHLIIFHELMVLGFQGKCGIVGKTVYCRIVSPDRGLYTKFKITLVIIALA